MDFTTNPQNRITFHEERVKFQIPTHPSLKKTSELKLIAHITIKIQWIKSTKNKTHLPKTQKREKRHHPTSKKKKRPDLKLQTRYYNHNQMQNMMETKKKKNPPHKWRRDLLRIYFSQVLQDFYAEIREQWDKHCHHR